MKKITQQELNQKAATGAKIKELRPAKPTEDEILSEVARVKVRQDDDFKVLADAIEKTSDGVERVHHELKELRRVKEGTVELDIQRQFDRLIHTIDIRKKTEDGKVRYLKATFLRDDQGDVQRIILAPGV